MSLMTARKRAKAVSFPQFPFLFPSVSYFLCLDAGNRKQRVFLGPFYLSKTLGNDRETKGPKPGLSFPCSRPSVSLSFHFCFLSTLWAWNENASTQTANPARIKPLAWRPRSAKERPRFEEFKRFVRWLRLPHLAPGKRTCVHSTI